MSFLSRRPVKSINGCDIWAYTLDGRYRVRSYGAIFRLEAWCQENFVDGAWELVNEFDDVDLAIEAFERTIGAIVGQKS